MEGTLEAKNSQVVIAGKFKGNIVAKSVIIEQTCDFNGNSVVDVNMEPAISVNPYFQFEATVPEAGEFTFTWYDDDGSVYEKKKAIKLA